jgi:glyoxylase-like metal-dependent hydrolase (beta-lactamase superfamily II)
MTSEAPVDRRAFRSERLLSDRSDEDPFVEARRAPASALTRLSPLVRRIVAPNPSPFTFTGTCSYIIGAGDVAILDPGPLDEAHVAALVDAVKGERIEAIVVTHTHRDHSPAAARLRQITGAPIVGAAPYRPASDSEGGLDAAHDRDYAPDEILGDGAIFRGRGFTLATVATPGHCANHLCFALPEENALFSGDHVMAWSTSVVAPPDGAMRAYMNSLDKLKGRDEAIYWPGHGGPVLDPNRYVRALIHHRRQREASILNALEGGAKTIPEIVGKVYAGLDPELIRAAGMSTEAQLADLEDRGLVVAEGLAAASARYRLA